VSDGASITDLSQLVTPERWAELKDLLASALALPESERSDLVAAIEGERPEVAAQLRAYLAASNLRLLGSDLDWPQTNDGVDERGFEHEESSGGTIGPYVIVSRLGRGGMGEVFLATDSRLHRNVALKTIRSPFLTTEQILHEARALAKLNHPNIATVYDVVSDHDRIYLVMEYLAGETLDLRIRNGPLSLSDIVTFGSEVAAALDYAHTNDVLHCDLKPANVVLATDGRAKVLDFGLARFASAQEHALTGGTPPYMAPEQYFGGPVDRSTDIYALGVMLLHMSRGQLPGQQMSGEVAAHPATHEALRAIITKATAFEPSERWSSAADLGRELAKIGEHAKTPTLPISFITARDGVKLAVAATGQGAPLIYVRGWITHLHHMWADVQYRHFIESLARDFRVVRYDGRGNGLADRVQAVKSLDELIDDLDAVVASVGAPEVNLLATCFGGPIAIEWARRHPERVRALVLDGTFLKGHGLASRTRRLLLRRGFASVPEFAFLVLSYLTNSSAVGQSYRSPRTLRDSIDPKTAASLYELAFTIDVEQSARQIKVPTLVLHRSGSTAVPIALGREVARSIPVATFRELPGTGHNPWDEDTNEYIALVREFVNSTLHHQQL
jgi:pimeloyl-ACP methyl ester carboxylesterase/predicted Ser/Thr protein kinase